MKVAVLAQGPEGPISFKFSKAPYILIYEIKGGKVEKVKELQNPFASTPSPGHKLVKVLLEEGVKVVVGPPPGPATSVLLQREGLSWIKAEPGESVKSALRKVIG